MPSNSPTGIPSNSSVIFVSVSVNVSLKIAPESTLMEGKSVNLRLKLPERFIQVRKSKTIFIRIYLLKILEFLKILWL